MRDSCVSCKKETVYDKLDHVDQSLGYVQGAGQLCLDCYDLIYIKPTVGKESYNAKKKSN